MIPHFAGRVRMPSRKVRVPTYTRLLLRMYADKKNKEVDGISTRYIYGEPPFYNPLPYKTTSKNIYHSLSICPFFMGHKFPIKLAVSGAALMSRRFS